MINLKLLVGLIIFLIIPLPLLAEPITFEKEYTYLASDIDSKLSSRAIAIEQTKRALLEELGTYLINETEVKNYQMTKDQITTLTAGIVSAVVLDEKWDGRTYYLKAKLVAEPKEVAKAVDLLRNDTQKSKELEVSKRKAEEAMKEVERLNKLLKLAKVSTKQQDDYNTAIKDLSAADWHDKGYVLFNAGDIQGAIDAYSKAIELNPRLGYAYMDRGMMYHHIGNYKKAIDDYDMVVKLNPRVAEAYYWRGWAYDSAGDANRAMNDYDEAIRLNPKHSKALNRRGLSYAALGINDRAIHDFDEAIRLNPKYAEAYSSRGACYFLQHNYNQAIKDSAVAIKLNPRDADAYLIRGLTYDKLGDRKQSTEDIKIAARLGKKAAQDYLKEKSIDW